MMFFLFAITIVLAISPGQGSRCTDVNDRMTDCAESVHVNFEGFKGFNIFKDQTVFQSMESILPADCKHQDAMVEIVDCTYDVMDTCPPENMLYMPSKSSAIQMVKKMCKDIDSIDASCLYIISSSEAQIEQCVRPQLDLDAMSDKSQRESTCISYSVMLNCAAKEIARCDRDTGKFLEKNVKLFLPGFCDGSDWWTPHMEGGAAGLKTSFSVFSLVLVWAVYFFGY